MTKQLRILFKKKEFAILTKSRLNIILKMSKINNPIVKLNDQGSNKNRMPH